MVHLAPDGRRLTATAPKIYGHVFRARDSPGPLTAAAGRSATLLSGCVGIVGRVGDERVLCRCRSGNCRTVDARNGRAEGNAVVVVREDDGRVAEGMVVSAVGAAVGPGRLPGGVGLGGGGRGSCLRRVLDQRHGVPGVALKHAGAGVQAGAVRGRADARPRYGGSGPKRRDSHGACPDHPLGCHRRTTGGANARNTDRDRTPCPHGLLQGPRVRGQWTVLLSAT